MNGNCVPVDENIDLIPKVYKQLIKNNNTCLNPKP